MKVFIIMLISLLSIKGFSQKEELSKIVSSKTAWLLSSNFTVPTVTFQPLLESYRTKGVNKDKPRGDLSFFNAVGAGISLFRANFKILTSKEDTTGIDINNQVGFQTGFLFSRSAAGTEEKNRFAIQIGISILDFQIGFGKEFI
jgi:hypothetical protein